MMSTCIERVSVVDPSLYKGWLTPGKLGLYLMRVHLWLCNHEAQLNPRRPWVTLMKPSIAV